MEEWKEIPGFEEYQVSDLGRVKSLKYGKEKILKGGKCLGGYYRVGFWINGKPEFHSRHRLVLMAFVGLPPKDIQACHNDGNRSNNKLSNLRWGTAKENCADRKKHGTESVGCKNGQSKLNEKQIREILNIKENYKMSHCEIGLLFGVSPSTIDRVVRCTSYKNIKRNYNEEIKKTPHYTVRNLP